MAWKDVAVEMRFWEDFNKYLGEYDSWVEESDEFWNNAISDGEKLYEKYKDKPLADRVCEAIVSIQMEWRRRLDLHKERLGLHTEPRPVEAETLDEEKDEEENEWCLR